MAQTDLLSELRYAFPWMGEMGLSPEWLQQLVATAATPEEVILKLRQEPSYRRRFPGLFREDGSIRMSEAEYLSTENSYRQLLRQFGFNDEEYSTPSSLKGFFDSEVDANELSERLTVYQNVRDSAQPVKDAFYVYAGLDVSTDDLFEAAVNKDFAAELQNAYRERLTSGFDYQTFIDRVTTVAGQRAAQLVSRDDNTLTINNVPTDPGLARQVLDVLYSTGGADGRQLSLQELLASYEEALIGAAAGSAGLGIPTKDRVAQIRAAGIERAAAQQAYAEFARQRGSLSASSVRLGQGAIDRTRFENAAFFGSADDTRALEMASAAERAAGEGGGSFRFDQDRSGRLYQRGLTS